MSNRGKVNKFSQPSPLVEGGWGVRYDRNQK